MAKIYESSGRRVQLTGPRQGRGFSPVAAVDRSSAVRQQSAEGTRQLERAQSFQQRSFDIASEAVQKNYQRSSGLAQDFMETAGRSQLANNRAANELQMQQTMDAWDLENRQREQAQRLSIEQQKETEGLQLRQLSGVLENDARNRAYTTEALSQFSKTLSDYVTETVKARNENDYKVGLALAMNGQIKIEDGQIRQVREAAQILSDAAAKEGQRNEALSQVNLPLAEQQRLNNPVLKGWKAYGAAVGRLKQAASRYQTAIDTFMRGADPLVPLPDGRIIAPKDARGEAELRASIAVGQQIFIDGMGLKGINPLLVVEHLSPTVVGVNDSVVANALAQGRKADQEKALFDTQAQIGTAWQTLSAEDPDAVQNFFQQTVKTLVANGVSMGEANGLFVDSITSLAIVTGRSDLLGAFEATALNPENPGMGTLGMMPAFAEKFKDAYTKLAAAEQQAQQEKEEEQNELVDRVLADHSSQLAAAGTDKQRLTQSFDQTRQILSQIAATGNLKAQEALSQLNSQGALYNPYAYAQIVQDLENGRQPPTDAQLQQMVLQGTINQDQANRIRAMKPDDKALDIAKQATPRIKERALALIRENFAANTVDRVELQSIASLMVETLTGETAVQLRRQLASFMAQGKMPSEADINGFIESTINGYRTDPRFNGKFDPKTGRMTANKPLSRSAFVTQATPQGLVQPRRDFTQVEPYQVQGAQVSGPRTYLLTPDELTQNTQRFLSGQGPTERANKWMRSLGISFQELLKRQSKAYEVPFTNIEQSQLVQAAQERRRLAPAAAAILDNPNTPAWRRTRAFREINAARARAEAAAQAAQARQQASAGGGAAQAGAPDLQAFRPLMDLIGGKEGGAQQYDAANRGTAGDTPEGVKGLSNMTLRQVMNLQRQGYNAVGRYQFIRGTLEETIRDAGLNPDTTKFTPQVQDQLFVTRLTQSRVRARLGAFLRGESNDIRAALNDLSNEFAVVKNFTGGNPLAGQGGNRPSIEATEAAQMLRRAREGFRRARASSSGGEVYLIDNLGYGSKGDHLDVKPMRPGTEEFDRSQRYVKGTLDRYVDIQLPDGTRGPLSQVAVTTDDDRAHRLRRSFGHDYAAPKNSKLFLKGGAKVVGSYPGEQGSTILIIELPDGRRYQFLHGRAPKR